ncbi:MAG: hypothetical protein B7Y36_08335 [Novosphingobium sp. 28-62-57]|uniref:DUF7146 domain-containing protein n=1 Tax=unclassified Novosphingobium TaxID=2644732 RepID=UPI000BCB3B32|nr:MULTISPECIES: toprim domain-containing protein [unclassified Novosphingobium]OYW47931.1 MAG: hypothetical protein B7Z36_01425 [Novosphingobium sp. 12-63-9]OYZ10824.1 MAG: hypothetical protein B7Y36_08335 [Novosphingobium sp. 28-62-57]
MTLISVAEIEQKLRDNAESIGKELLPGAHKEGAYLKAGSVMGEAGDSLVLQLRGTKQGTWRDYAGTDYGDMLDLIQQTQGLDKKGAVSWAKDRLGIVDAWTPAAVRSDPEAMARKAAELAAMQRQRDEDAAAEREVRVRRARGLYLSGVDIAGTPAAAYLRGRAIDLRDGQEWPGCLRYHAEVWNKDERCKIPAMLAPIYTADGQLVAVHRTYLQICRQRGWAKIDGKNAKKVLGAMWGGFVPINKGASGKSMAKMPEGEPVYVTEGIEDALVVRMIKPELRVIAAVSLGNIGAIVLPENARRIVIVADRDEKPKAIEALERSIAQQQARGMDVRLVMPPAPFKDVNDWLRGTAASGVAA